MNLTALDVTSTLIQIKFFSTSSTNNTIQNNKVRYKEICITKISMCSGELSCQKINNDATGFFENLKPYCVYTFVGHLQTNMDLKWINLTTPAVEVKTRAASMIDFSIFLMTACS